ncbi:MAG: spondin domain-containing protein [Sandaracinobacteroides sp.]
MKTSIALTTVMTFALAATPAAAALVDVTVKVENLAPQNSISFAPLRFGFHNGSFDSFDNGVAATAPIISVAEGGSGTDWFPAFAAAEPQAVLGSTAGALLPGASFTTMTFRIDTSVNRYFTFGSMVIPSNDYFIGNDDPLEYRLFNMAGDLLISEINQTSDEIWDGGSELFDPAAAAFLVGGTNALRTAQNGVVNFDFAELAGFNGLETAGGYTFDSQLRAGLPIYRISFTANAVPEPASWALMILGFGAVGGVLRRRSISAVSC